MLLLNNKEVPPNTPSLFPVVASRYVVRATPIKTHNLICVTSHQNGRFFFPFWEVQKRDPDQEKKNKKDKDKNPPRRKHRDKKFPRIAPKQNLPVLPCGYELPMM